MKCNLGGILLVLALAGPASAQTLLGSDARHRHAASATDIVFVAEGWLAGEEAEFLAASRAAVQLVEGDPAARPILDGLRVDWHHVFVPSPERPHGSKGQPARRSACGAHVDAEGTLIVDDARARTHAAVAPGADCVVTLIRFERGSAVANADFDGRWVHLPVDDPESLLHELGHALLGLGDEYADEGGRIPAERAHEVVRFPNLTTDPNGARWAHIVSGAHEGGGGFRRGVFHPERECRMRTARRGAFCKVCLAQLEATRVMVEPELLAPGAGGRIEAGAPLVARFRAKNSVAAVGWYLDLHAERGGGHVKLASRAVEGQYGAVDLGALAPGKYLLGLAASNLGGTTKPVWVRFEVVAPARGLAAELGALR